MMITMNKPYRTICFFIFCLAALSLASCRKEKGNYNYHDINEAVIAGIDSAYTSQRGAVLQIVPTFTFTKDDGKDTAKYTYRWLLVDQSVSPAQTRVLAVSRDLHWQVDVPANPVDYLIYYTVTEKSTDVSWRKQFDLTITSDMADGWAILNDISGHARLDYFNYQAAADTFQHFTDVLATQSTLSLKGKPVLATYYYRRSIFGSQNGGAIVIGTDQQTFIMDVSNYSFDSYIPLGDAMTNYYAPPYYAQLLRAQGSNSISYLYDNLGNLFYELPTVGEAYGNPVNQTADGTPVAISPWFAEGYHEGTPYALMYDTIQQRFMEHKSSNRAVSVPVNTSGILDPAHIGMRLLYMASTPAVSAQMYAVFKNNNGKIFLARMSANNDAFVPLAFDEVKAAPEMANASQFAIDPQQGYLIYTVGSRMYRYNPYDNTHQQVLDLGNKVISLLKYQKLVSRDRDNPRYVEYSQKLIVCSYDQQDPDHTGKMDLYSVPALNGPLSLYQSFNGLGKVVDVTYKEQ
jgi:PKD-like family